MHGSIGERYQLRKQAARAGEREGPLRDAFEHLAGPERARVRAELPHAKKLLTELEGQFYGHLHFQIAHPEALRRLERLDREIATVAYEMDVERQSLDGIAPSPPQLPRSVPELDRVLDRGIDLGL